MKKTISLTIPHRLTKEQARRRLDQGIAELRTRHAASISNLSETWNGNQLQFGLTAMGQAISGRVELLDDAVKLDVDLPWLLATLAARFTPRIEEEARRMLAKQS